MPTITVENMPKEILDQIAEMMEESRIIETRPDLEALLSAAGTSPESPPKAIDGDMMKEIIDSFAAMAPAVSDTKRKFAEFHKAMRSTYGGAEFSPGSKELNLAIKTDKERQATRLDEELREFEEELEEEEISPHAIF